MVLSVGGIPEAIEDGHNGVLVPPENVEALAAGIVKLASDRDFAEKLGRNALDPQPELALRRFGVGDLRHHGSA